MQTGQSLPNSTAVLVLGICSILFGCFFIGLVLGIIGIVMASKGRKIYREDPESYEGYSTLTTGYVLSIIGTVLGSLYVLYLVIWVAILGGTAFSIWNLARPFETKNTSTATVEPESTTFKKAEEIFQSPPPPAKKIIRQKEPVYHEVKSQETVYRIATMNDLTVDELKELNQLESNGLSVGQQLIVGYRYIEKEVEVEAETEAAQTEESAFAENERESENERVYEDERTEQMRSSNNREDKDQGENSIGIATNKPYAKLLEEYHSLLCEIQKDPNHADYMDNLVKQGEITQKLAKLRLNPNDQVQYLADFAKAMNTEDCR